MPSKVTGSVRSKRWRDRLKGNGWVQVSIVIPEGRRDEVKRLAAEWCWSDARPDDFADDAHPALPLGEPAHD